MIPGITSKLSVQIKQKAILFYLIAPAVHHLQADEWNLLFNEQILFRVLSLFIHLCIIIK